MVTGPRDGMGGPARGLGRMRASDADREQAIDALKAAFVQGRLAKDELDARVGCAFASRTYAELAAVTADIPAAPAEAQPERNQARPQGRPSVKKVAATCACGVLAAELILFLVILAVPVYAVLDLAVIANLVGLPLAGGKVLDTWREDRSRGQLPPRPAQRRQEPEGEQDTTIGNDLTFSEIRRDAGDQAREPRRASSSSVRRSAPAATFSPRCVRLLVPGIAST